MSFNFMVEVTIHNDFGSQENKMSLFLGVVYASTLHSLIRALSCPSTVSIQRAAMISILLSRYFTYLEQVLYRCQWNKWAHLTTPCPLHACICIFMPPSLESSPFISQPANFPCPSSRPQFQCQCLRGL